jgi:hypothetical protein
MNVPFSHHGISSATPFGRSVTSLEISNHYFN